MTFHTYLPPFIKLDKNVAATDERNLRGNGNMGYEVGLMLGIKDLYHELGKSLDVKPER